MFLYTDIETLPTRSDEGIKAVTSNLEPPSNYKNPDVIEKWLKENTESAIAKTSFDAAYGEIACIGWEHVDGGAEHNNCPSQIGISEVEMLKMFVEQMNDVVGTRHPMIVTHNGNNFDLPFIRKRCIVHGIKIPKWFPTDFKPWSKETFDTMLQWDQKNYISMDRLAKLFGIQGKNGVDGSMVAQMWADGKQQEVVDYCLNGDIPMLRKIHEHMMKALG